MSKKKSEPITGAVPVMAMPFDNDGIIDGDSLRHQIDFCIEAGAKGIDSNLDLQRWSKPPLPMGLQTLH